MSHTLAQFFGPSLDATVSTSGKPVYSLAFGLAQFLALIGSVFAPAIDAKVPTSGKSGLS